MGRENLEVDFFGGEPMMNFEVVKEIVSYARSKEQECGKNFRFEFHHIGASAARDGHSCFLRMCMIHKVMY